jgi:hypothetical protein
MKRPRVATARHPRNEDMKKTDQTVEAKVPERDERPERRNYQPPRIVKKRAVSRATLFSGCGPDSGGVIGPCP